MELSENLYAKIIALSEEADEMFESGLIEKSIELNVKALSLVPVPKEEWEATTWLATAIGDGFYELGGLENANTYYELSYKSPGGIENPYVNFCLGQINYDFRRFDKSQEFFMRAYMLGGYEVFEGEDPKYFETIKNNI